jgi:hypothetical protein
MNMTVRNRLTRNHTIVDTDVETLNCAIIGNDIVAKLRQKFIDGHRFLAVKIEIRSDMPAGQNQRMERCYRIKVADRKNTGTIGYYHRWLDYAKRAGRQIHVR